MQTLVFWLLFVAFVGAFAAQVATRVRLIAAAPEPFSFDDLGFRLQRFVLDVVLQRRTIRERPLVGLAHAFVFWGFVAFGGYTLVEFLHGLGIVDLTGTRWFWAYRILLIPFATAVLGGILFLLVRRAFVRPVALGTTVSIESIVIALFIATLMVTFLLGFNLDEDTMAGRVNWWAHMLVILAFLALIPGVEASASGAVADHGVPEVAGARPRAESRFREGRGRPRDRQGSRQQDRARRVHVRRVRALPGELPGVGRGEGAESERRSSCRRRRRCSPGERDAKLGEVYSEKVLWQCTTCGACENQCPVGIEHLPIIIGARRGLVSNGEAPGVSRRDVQQPRAPQQHLGPRLRPAAEVRRRRPALEIFDPAKHDVLVWLGCAGSFEADFQKSLRSMFDILRAKQVRFGVLSKEQCTGDPAKRTGNEYMFQELANANIEDLKAAGPKKILTSCPHCVKTIGDDYRRFGYEVEIVHSSVFVAGAAAR